MKVCNSSENSHLQQLTAVKEELVQALLQFSKILSETALVDVLNRASFCSENKLTEQNGKEGSSYKYQVDYIRNFLLFAKIFPTDIRLELGWKVLRDCDILLEDAFQELLSSVKLQCEDGVGENEKESCALQRVQMLILPTGQLIHDCIEMNLLAIESSSESRRDVEKLEQTISYSVSIFDRSMRFLVTSTGISLEKPEFLRILGLGQKVLKFFNCCAEFGTLQLNELIKRKMEEIDELVAERAVSLLPSENGRSLVKFWCEIRNLNDARNESKLYTSLQDISLSSNNFSEIYMVFTSYFENSIFWATETGKKLTPILIRAIMADLSCDKAETRKRAAFVLRLLVDQYSQNVSIFDANIPEVSLISLNKMKTDEYVKFWGPYFDLYDILNETQLHIVQPILQKLQIFKQHSTNDSVLVWLPIILNKMIGHDNRNVVKEGFEQFLQAREYLENTEGSSSLRQLFKDFLKSHIMPLIRDHIGWILHKPDDFFKNIVKFGQLMVLLYANHQLPGLKTAEIILYFLTSSGKCMGPHTIFFLVSSVDDIICGDIKSAEKVVDGKLISCMMEMLMNQVALLLSNNLTTVSKYFRELLEHRCVSILLKTMPILVKLPKIEMDSFIFMKLLTFMGSLSAKVFYDKRALDQIQSIIRTFNSKDTELLATLVVQSKMYHFVKSCLSATSTVGMLRLVGIWSQICSKDVAQKIQTSVENFAILNGDEELLPGSIQGLSEFYQQSSFESSAADIYVKMFNELCDMLLKSSDNLSSNGFMLCLRRLEVLSILPSKTLPNTTTLPQLSFPSCHLKRFLLQKLYNISKHVNSLPIHALKYIASGTVENFRVDDDISESYFSATERNLYAEYYQVQFYMSVCIIDSNLPQSINIDRELLVSLLRFILDNIEKCDFKGVATGLQLTQSVLKCVHYTDDWDGTHLLDEIVSVGWSLVFELRKSEAFWLAIKAFVELICFPYFVNNGYLDKYVDLLFEHGDSVSGLPLMLVQHLVKVDYPPELLGEIHRILVKASLAGGPLLKNIRVSFAIWDYMRKDANISEVDYDPEKYEIKYKMDISDCKARLLACEKLRSNIDCLSLKDAVKASSLLFESVQALLERDDLESKKRRRYFQGSATHRIKQRIWQILLALQPYFDFEISKLVLEKALNSLSTDSPQPSVRYMGEWIIILIVQRYPELNTIFFECLDNCIQTRLGFGAFFSTICLHISKLLKSQEFYDRALQSLATLSLSQHLTVRIYSQVAFQKMYERAAELKFTNIIEKFATILSALERASTFVSGNCSKLLENVSHYFYVNFFDCVTHYCPEVIFTLLPRLAGVIKDECILQPKTIRKIIQGSHYSAVKDGWSCSETTFLDGLEKTYMDNEKSAWHLKSIVADGRELGEEVPNKFQPVELEPNQIENKEMNYQKKINPWKLLSVSEEIEEYSNTNSKKKCVSEEGLVVVASLLDHLPNLGGLCRTCEIFGVHKYVINSLKVVNDQHFQSLSVSAQNWVNILEVQPRDLESFICTYAAKGYTILGVEQANESLPLTDYHFPKKSVLLLGNEKLGIPPELLRLVDKCIEIPQVGIIRSLNVHVTGALCIWQYASQNIL